MKKILCLTLVLLVIASFTGSLIYAHDDKAEGKVKIIEKDTFIEVYINQDGKTKIKVQLNIADKQELNLHKDNMDAFVKEVRASNKLGKSKSLIENAVSTVTFAKPISIKEIKSIKKKYNVEIVDYEVKFINQDGIWGTGCLKDLSEEKISELSEKILTEGKEASLEYIGVTSARIRINLSKGNYEKMISDPLIYLVDITDPMIRLENDDFDNQLKIQVPDLAWEIDKIK